MYEARPDPFHYIDSPILLDQSREAVAGLLKAPVETVVLVSNASIGVNTVLRNLQWNDDCKDEIIYFGTIYVGCGRTVDYIVDTRYGKVAGRQISLEYPIEDAEIVSRFHAAVAASRAEGKRPRICVFDAVSSKPGVRFPFEAMAAACREAGVMSLMDAAQGIGMVDLNVAELDPDFLVSNCHKWLHVPRGCAVFYVPLRNQHLILSGLPTNHGYVAKNGPRAGKVVQKSKSRFVFDFEFNGTIDNAPFLCVKDSIAWRRDVLGGEEKIRAYLQYLAKEGGKRVAEILGTEVMDNSTGTLTNCGMVNVALPLAVKGEEGGNVPDAKSGKYALVSEGREDELSDWISDSLVNDYRTFIPLLVHRGRWWGRLSAQVYLSLEDFEWTGKTLRELCERAGGLDYVTPVEKSA